MKTLRMITMVIMTVLMWGGFASCSSDDEDGEPKFPVVEFYYKGSCIGTLNEKNLEGNFEIQDILVGNIGEKIEIEARVISGSGVSLENSHMGIGRLYLPEYISVSKKREENVTINSKPICIHQTFSIEINKRTIIPRTFQLEFQAWDNNGSNSGTLKSYFYVTFNIKGEEIQLEYDGSILTAGNATFKTIHLDSNEHELFFHSLNNTLISICKRGTEFGKQEWIDWMTRSFTEWDDEKTACYSSFIVSKNDSGEPRVGSLVFENERYTQIPVVIIEQDPE